MCQRSVCISQASDEEIEVRVNGRRIHWIFGLKWHKTMQKCVYVSAHFSGTRTIEWMWEMVAQTEQLSSLLVWIKCSILSIHTDAIDVHSLELSGFFSFSLSLSFSLNWNTFDTCYLVDNIALFKFFLIHARNTKTLLQLVTTLNFLQQLDW